MKLIFWILSFVLFGVINAQEQSSALTAAQRGNIMLIEKKMQRIGLQFLGDTNQDNRIKGAREFVKLLVEALKVENSFQYPFDSIPYLSKVTSEDKKIRVLTFQVLLKDYTCVHYGCIQLNRKNIKLIPLRDFSDTFPITPQYMLTNKNWLGAVYYKILTKYIQDKPVYFLFGFDQNDLLTDKKYIEAMWIERDSIAKFGMPIFEKTFLEAVSGDNKLMQSANSKPIPPRKLLKTYYRYVLEYRKNAIVSLRFDENDKNLIVHDHIAPLDKKAQDVGFMKVPDGTYEGLKWVNNKWVWQDYIKIAEEENNIPIRPVPKKENKNLPKN